MCRVKYADKTAVKPPPYKNKRESYQPGSVLDERGLPPDGGFDPLATAAWTGGISTATIPPPAIRALLLVAWTSGRYPPVSESLALLGGCLVAAPHSSDLWLPAPQPGCRFVGDSFELVFLPIPPMCGNGLLEVAFYNRFSGAMVILRARSGVVMFTVGGGKGSRSAAGSDNIMVVSHVGSYKRAQLRLCPLHSRPARE